MWIEKLVVLVISLLLLLMQVDSMMLGSILQGAVGGLMQGLGGAPPRAPYPPAPYPAAPNAPAAYAPAPARRRG